MTTPQNPVDALMALVSEYAIVVMDDYARGFAPGVKQKQARAAVEASARALAAIPEGWQPIESLPRDETPVLIGHYYVDGVNEYSGPSRWLWVTSGGFDANTFWHDFTDDADLLSQDGSWKTATHWRPALAASPTPPTAPAQDAQGVEDDEINSPFNACMFRDKCPSMTAALRASSPADRIEADEALMRQALEALFTAKIDFAARDTGRLMFDAAITALRKRLESSK